jgi:BirA family transcriptional regulator, biotin operon repressor / biotin---[acetyl-CoA-carboxylase] ligase
LSSHSKSQIIGKPFIQLVEVDSTNNYAMAQIHNGLAEHGSTWFALSQTAGKGQRGKQWLASSGMNVLQTTVLDASPFNLTIPFVLTAVVANACYEFFSYYAGDETKIKWPNDIYWRDRKAGGILIENVIRGNTWMWSLIGIGININQTTFDNLPNPVSLKQITGKSYDTIELGKSLCGYLNKYYQQYFANGSSAVFDLYNQHLYKKNETVKLQKNGLEFSCTIKEVLQNGDLLVDDCGWEKFSFGEVEWIIS